jgi:hypothetical protein
MNKHNYLLFQKKNKKQVFNFQVVAQNVSKKQS